MRADHPLARNREFRSLCLDTVFYATGSGGEQVIFGLLVLQVTGSSWWVGVAFALHFAPLLILGGAAGAVADWLPRLRLLRLAEVWIGIVLAALAVLVGTGTLELWHVLMATFVTGCVRAVYQPVRLSYAVDLVGTDKAAAGLASLQMGNRIGQGTGALLTGVVMQYLGAEYAYFTLALCHLTGFLILGTLTTTGGVAPDKRESLGRTFRDFGAEMVHNRTLLVLVIANCFVNIFGFVFMTVLPEFVTVRLGLGADALGLLIASRALGGSAAMLVYSMFGSQRRLGTSYALVVALLGVGLVLFGLANSFVTAIGAMLVVAASTSLTNVISQAMMQLSVVDHLRGRAMGAWMISVGLTPLGTLQIGAVAAWLGAHMALMVNGATVAVCAALITMVIPRINRLSDVAASRSSRAEP